MTPDDRNIEDRLHDALHEYADPIEPAPGSWSRIEARLHEPARPSRSRARPLALVGALLAVALAAGTAIAVRANGGDDRHRVRAATAPRTPTWSEKAAVRDVVMARDDGKVFVGGRFLAEAEGVDAVSATPSGNEVLFTSRHGQECSIHDGSTQPEIDRLALAMGAERSRVVGGAHTPVVTPNGVWVAYGIQCDGVSLGITNLQTGENYRTDFLPPSMRDANVRRVEVLGASPNSRRLVYRVTIAGDAQPRYYASCLWPLVEHRDTSFVELPSDGTVTAATFVDDDHVALAATTPSGNSRFYRWSLRASDGRQQATPVLFTVPDRVISLVADPSGTDFLALTDDHVLYRWDGSDPEPAQVANDIRAMAWIASPGA